MFQSPPPRLNSTRITDRLQQESVTGMAGIRTKAIYAALGIDNQPGGIKRRHFRPERDF